MLKKDTISEQSIKAAIDELSRLLNMSLTTTTFKFSL